MNNQLCFLLPELSILSQPKGIQAGATALQSLATGLESYIDPVTTVIYVIAAIIGLVGALKVYINMQQSKDNVMANTAAWFGACLFILVANTILRLMFTN